MRVAEAVVALSALLFIPVAGWLSASTAPAAPWGVVLAFAAVVVPATAMGTTLPLFVAGLVPDRAELARGLGRLYSVNLLGGVLGALLTGVVLLPRLGLRSALLVLGAAGLAATLVALAVAPRHPPAAIHGADERRTSELGPSRWVVAVAAAVGALSFCLQVCYGRVFSLLFGSAAYTFSAVVATVLCALGVGGAMAARPVPASAFAGVVSRRLLALAVWTYLATLAVRIAPELSALAARSTVSLAGLRLTVLFVVVGLPMLEVGALFPLLASRFSPALVGRATGRALRRHHPGQPRGRDRHRFRPLADTGASPSAARHGRPRPGARLCRGAPRGSRAFRRHRGRVPARAALRPARGRNLG